MTGPHAPPCIYTKVNAAVLALLIALMAIFCTMASRASDRAAEAARKAEALQTDMVWVKSTLTEIKTDVKDIKREQ